jgi:hypothetical protein
VDQALSRICEGLFSFGPGSKSKCIGRKKKIKNRKRRLRWVPKAPKPSSFEPLAESVGRPVVGPSSTLDCDGSEISPAVSEPPGGSCPMLTAGLSVSEKQLSSPVQGPWPDSVAAAREDGAGPSVRMGSSPVTPEGSGGLFSNAVQPEPFLGLEGPEANLAVVDSPLKAVDALGVGAVSDPSDSLVISDLSPSPSLVSGPLGLRSRNWLVSVLISEGDGVSSVGIPRE